MMSVEQARAAMLAAVVPLGTEAVSVADAWNRVLARPVRSRRSHPPSDVSAMDGWAVQAADTARGSRLRVAGEVRAGRPPDRAVAPGEAVRIFTGAPVPDGADAILIQENATREGETVLVNAPTETGRHIRRAGYDFTLGEELVAAGRRMSPRDVGLAAAANQPWLTVHRQPRVAILATGDEIKLPGEPLGPADVVSSNSILLAALVRAVGGIPTVLPVAGDSRDELRAVLRDALSADVLVSSGGASVGDYDLMQSVLDELGMRVLVNKVSMRPGKPVISGVLDGTMVVCLPGNPVSAATCGALFLLPVVERLAGLEPGELPVESARTAAPLRANDERKDFLRATITASDGGGLPSVTPFQRQDSGNMSVLSRSDALIVREPLAPEAAAGDAVPIVRLSALHL